MNKPILYLIILLHILPGICAAQFEHNKRPFPTTKHHQLKYEYIDELHSGRMLVRNFDGIYGYVDSEFREVVPCVYDYAEPFGNGRAGVVKGRKCGLIDTIGNVLIPCIYNSMKQNHRSLTRSQVWTMGIDRYVIVKDDDTTRIYDLSTKVAIIPDVPIDNNSYYDENPYRVVHKNGKDGLQLESGRLAAPMIYYSIDEMNEGMMRVSSNWHYGFCDSSRTLVIDTIYEDVHQFSEGLAAVKINGKWGYINKSGVVTIPACYDWVGNFANGTAIVRTDTLYGSVNKAGLLKIPCIYSEFNRSYSEALYGIMIVRSGNKWALIDSSNKLLTSFRYDHIAGGSIGYSITENGKYSFIDKKGYDTSLRKYDEIITNTQTQFNIARRDAKWTIIDSFFNEVVPDTFNTELDARDVLYPLAYTIGRKQPRLIENGKYVIAMDFRKGKAAVRNTAGKWGYINRKGKEVIPCSFSDIGSFIHGRAYAAIDGKRGFINKKGKFIVSYGQDTFQLHKKLMLVSRKKRVGTSRTSEVALIDEKCKVIIPFLYNDITWIHNDKLLVEKDDEFGIIDMHGNVLFPLGYSQGAGLSNGVMVFSKDKKTFILNKMNSPRKS